MNHPRVGLGLILREYEANEVNTHRETPPHHSDRAFPLKGRVRHTNGVFRPCCQQVSAAGQRSLNVMAKHSLSHVADKDALLIETAQAKGPH